MYSMTGNVVFNIDHDQMVICEYSFQNIVSARVLIFSLISANAKDRDLRGSPSSSLVLSLLRAFCKFLRVARSSRATSLP